MMRVTGRPLGAMVLLLPLLAACAPAPNNSAQSDLPVAGAALPGSAQAARQSLAITHRYTLRVPSAETEAVQQKHLAECVRLGCSVLSTSIDRANEGRIGARTSVRIKPESFDAFAAALAAPPAQIIIHAQSAEDMTAPIVDAERRLEAKTVLRDRLTAMLRDQTVKTAADLITIERELAQAQSEIEAITAQRDSLRTRTDTIRIDISYVGAARQIGGADLSPIYQASNAINQTAVNSVSWLIWFIAAAVPWLPVIAVVWWGTRRLMRRWRVRKLPG
ncbi:DUF4349 domain-containing protein [Bradyrhizobium sp. WSM 1704]|uniref:DUF4349 domain-containing protein n=1 Tax=Bradyrhizobium semiaridum TaxID=2821404 RepID=UPI001CE27A41|nr:DUF4349 domain-containing protein [Bradyrhizobium semiaridum]MCA6123361.1 DUF4349 domain-containing protein [Bradyrhizobium semiaridum]